MKKIYSKFTIERKQEFQLETSIVTEDGKKQVVKSPLNGQAENHVSKMYSTYTSHRENKLFSLVRGELQGKNMIFDFVDGKSFCSELLECVEEKNKSHFIELIFQYQKIIESMVQNKDSRFQMSPQFEGIFGKYAELTGCYGACNLNIDMTFDNIIKVEDGTRVVIDYEWYMDFSIPINFVLYRAIHGFCVKYSQSLRGFTTEEELLGILAIDKEEWFIYEKMNNKFVEYVYGKEESYDTILTQYEKSTIDVQQHLKSDYVDVQVFVDDGSGYSVENCISKSVKVENQKVDVIFDLSAYDTIRALRIDPMEGPGFVGIEKIEFLDDNKARIEIGHVITNATMQPVKNSYIFRESDPQIIYSNSENKKVTELRIQYLLVDLDNTPTGEVLQMLFNEERTSKIQELEAQIEDLKAEKEYILINKQGLEQRLNMLANDYRMLQYEVEKR